MITLPGFAIQSKIYESSVSLVYRGIRVQDGRAIVIKLLKQDYPSPQELTRYRQEYAITRSLDVEGVIKVYSQQDYQRSLLILLEDFGGESLEYWIRQRPEKFCPMPLSTFLPLAIQLSKILGNIHAASIVHKDIHPGNIVLNPDTGVVKIIDFGVATQFSRTNPMFKSPHVLEGTIAYLSPEQTGRMNRLLDYRTDFYSLGVTFYELLTGQLPFSTTDVLELIYCHIAKQPVPPHELNTAIPKPISDMILKLMAKNAEDRYQSAWGIKADLETYAQQLEKNGRLDCIVLGLHDISDQFQIPQKLYGREVEIEALLAAFERVAGREEGGMGRYGDTETRRYGEGETSDIPASPRPSIPAYSELLLVSGHAGIGKSALVQELYKPITEKRGYFVSGKFDQFQRNTPYSAIVTALKQLMQQLLGEPDDRVQQWRSQLLNALGNNGQLIIEVIPEVELIIGSQQPAPEVGATKAQNRFNRVFQQFIRVFCSVEHPLVIFLDDLQWVDSATLKLIELMMIDTETQHLFLIGAYRDNMVSLSHPLTMTLEGLQKQGVRISQISLAPLELNAITQLTADTLHTELCTVHSLAELVLRKTGGNPFFVNEFLKTLYAENLLSFNFEQLCWQWNIAQIEGENITDNVVELMLSKLKKLPTVTQQILQLAACIGANFDLSTLSIICDRSPNEIFSELLIVVQFGLIVPISELDEQLFVQDYKFLHDRVQQAAYALINESQKQIVHLQIGRNLLEKTLPEQRSNRLFEIVDHLNHGIELVSNPGERDEIAGLNLSAAKKAKAAIAYRGAKKYLAIARDWLAASSWQTNYNLTLDLYIETTELAYLCGDFENVERLVAIVLQNAKTVLDSVKIYEVKIQAATAQGRLLDAINTALQVLRQLEISFPATPNQLDTTLEFNAVSSRLNQKSIQDLFHLPEMVDPQKVAAMRILSRITLVAYHATPALAPLLVLKQVNLSTQYGNTCVSPFSYANFGLIYCGTPGGIETGYEFGQLALRLLSDLNAHSLKARTLFIVTNFIIHWRKHIRETANLFLEAYQCGLETGDLEFAAYSAFTYCLQSFFVGKELLDVEQEMAAYSEEIRQINQTTSLTWIQIFRQSVLNLMGRSLNPLRLVGETYDEEKRPTHQEMDGVILFLVHLNKLILCYLFSDYTQASENAVVAEHYVSRVAATPHVPLCYFYGTLARLAIYFESDTQVQQEILKEVEVNLEKMKQWSHHAPMNYSHKCHLVEAERARVLGQLLEAEEFYEQAIQEAKENEYIQEEALACELAAKFYLARGREKIAQLYMKEAHYCYQRWGAIAKVKDLETRYPQFFPQSLNLASAPTHIITKTTSSTSPIAFDLAAVMKASQAISREIELSQLLRSLMQILIENAGAQTGYLILENSEGWFIEAACEINDVENTCAMQVLQSISMENRLPESVVQYVIRTHESVILNHATREGHFTHDPYIQNNQTQSLLCLPLLNQSQLVGVLYLENQLATGVFTPERSQVLHLLSTHAAIAIENAKLYSELRTNESKMAQFLEAIPIGIGIMDAAGRPYYFNRRAIQLLGKGIDPAITPDQIPEIYQIYLAGTAQKYPIDKLPVMRALNGKYTRIDDAEIRQNNVTIPVEAWGTPVFDEQGNVAYTITTVQDITERKQAERLLADYNRTLEQQVAERTAALQKNETELRRQEQELRLIADALPVLISYVDANRCYQFINRTYEIWFNRSRDEILGNPVRQLLGETVYQRVEPYINQVFEGQTVSLEVEIPFPQGKRFISATLIPDLDANAQVKGFYSLITDISDRKRAEEASILEERNHMAREIHDTLAQAFTGIVIHARSASNKVTTDPEKAQTLLTQILDVARSGLAEARRSVEALRRPYLLESGNLQDALSCLVAQLGSSIATQIVYNVIGTPYPLVSDVENNLFRIGQEALTNAIKHARAREIRMELIYEPTQCSLQIQDDGQGFEVENQAMSNGFGLLGMAERAERISAELRIQSNLGQGTEITVSINRE